MSKPFQNLTHHILPTSATMLGVCMTVIPIIKLMHLGHLGTIIDKLLAVDSLFFLASALSSYLAMRTSVMANLERHADTTFIVGLVGMGCCAFLLAFELI